MVNDETVEIQYTFKDESSRVDKIYSTKSTQSVWSSLGVTYETCSIYNMRRIKITVFVVKNKYNVIV